DGDEIWAAGGRTGKVRAYSMDGDGPTTWTTEDGFGFYNDIAATEDGVYLTDSFVPQLEVMPPPVTGRANFWRDVPLSGDLEYVDGAFNVNGIVSASAGLVVVQSTPGALFRVDPETGETFRIDIGDVQLAGGDGLELDGSILYVVRNSANVVTVLELDETLTTASLVAELRHDDFDTPTTAALIGDDLWVVNARFGSPAGAGTAYWLTRVDAFGGTDG
ncbi:MAG: superoxide dismutase, partial [Chloroflexota bacterium]|nr:superoxide dismutase [Chloroflexota bacterium]